MPAKTATPKHAKRVPMKAKPASKVHTARQHAMMRAAMASVNVPQSSEIEKVEFWADQLAGQIAARVKAAGRTEAVCKAGASPSGAKHIGNLFDVMKSYIVYKAVRKNGMNARFILTHDDRDPLRTIPARLPTLEGELVDASKFREEFVKYIGHPYHTIPDPFGCCHSWAEHFSHVWENGIIGCGISDKDIQFVSNDYMYESGKFEPYITAVLQDIKNVRKVFAPFQQTMKPDYVPLNVICENCGKITAKVTDWDFQNRTLTYSCETKMLTVKYAVTGCGHKGTVPWSKGKLAWRFEWPAQWGIFNTDFEAFGKEHAEGSWPSGQAIAREIYKFEPPIPHVYEFLLVEGKKMSARFGNVYIAQDLLDVIEPEIFLYFYTKRSKKQRDLDLKTIYQLVDDFEHVERVYWGTDEETNAHDRLNAVREYESAMPFIPKRQPIRIEYKFAAMLGQLAPDTDTALKMLRASGHIKQDYHLEPAEIAQIARRLTLARKWVHRYSPETAITVNDKVPSEIRESLTPHQTAALHDLGGLLGTDVGQQDLYNAFYEISKSRNLPTKDFFQAMYKVLINKRAGPRLAPFILALGRERVRAILEQV